MCQCAKVSMCQCAMAHLCLFANLLLASFSAAGHTCPGTNSWCYMSFEDFVLVLFLEFREPYFIRQKYAFFKKGNFPPTDLAENLCVEPQTPPRSKSKSWQMGIFWPKNFVKGRGIIYVLVDRQKRTLTVLLLWVATWITGGPIVCSTCL